MLIWESSWIDRLLSMEGQPVMIKDIVLYVAKEMLIIDGLDRLFFFEIFHSHCPPLVH